MRRLSSLILVLLLSDFRLPWLTAAAVDDLRKDEAVPFSATVFKPGAIWQDNNGTPINAHGGGFLYVDGTYYWYGEHKTPGSGGNSAHVGVHVYRSTNLTGWTDEGIALAVTQGLPESDPGHEIEDGCVLERPKVIFNVATGKYVMWFHLELKGQGYAAARSGVAVADKPTGPFRYLGSFRPNAGVWPENSDMEITRQELTPEEIAAAKAGGPKPQGYSYRRDFQGGQMARDMTLFVDDDGKAYHIYSSEENSTIQISQLSDNYLSEAGHYWRVLPGKYREAPALFKHNGKYYLITSTTSGWAPNAAGLAIADNIRGPWTWVGNPCKGTDEENKVTFDSQSTYILPVDGQKDAFIFMADRWNPSNAIDGRYIWLPVQWQNDQPVLRWLDSWSPSFFTAPLAPASSAAP